jgi:PAS domain S-box-containing protein
MSLMPVQVSKNPSETKLANKPPRRRGPQPETLDRQSDGSPATVAFFKHNPLPMWIYDTRSLRILLVNEAAVEHYGYSRDEFLRMTIMRLHPPAEHPRLTAHLSRPRGSREETGPWQHLRRDGTRIDVEVISNDIPYEDHAARLIVALDVTDRLRADAERRRMEDKYRGMFEGSTEAITQSTPDGRYIAANPAAARMLGFASPAELMAERGDLADRFYVQPGRRDEFIRLMHSQGEVRGFESEVYRKDGSTMWISENSRVVRGKDGAVLYFQGAAQDITARKLAEAALRQAEEKYRLIFENATEEIIQTTPAGQYLTANPAAARMLGFDSPGQLIREYNDLNQHFYVQPGRRAEFLRLMEEHGEVSGFESEVFRRDGSRIWISESSRAIKDGQGNVLYFQGTAQNITERRRAEERLGRQMRHMAAQRRIDAAISGSLELKSMLSIVLDDVIQVLEVDAAAVSLLASDSMFLEVAAARGFNTRDIQSSQLVFSADVAGKVLLQHSLRSPGNIRVTAESARRQSLMETEQFVFYCGVPLISKGRITGLLEVFARSQGSRDADWQQLVDGLAAQAAIAVENASMFAELQRSNVDLALAYEATIEGWSRALDLRDRETEGHTVRVTEMTLSLARSLGVRQEALGDIRRGALLHDIGKIGVPDSILLKPGPLTAEEQEVMRRHPMVAYEMLSPIAYLRPALDIPYCHHERWDGSGYPRGLKGEEIPLAARIFSVVDVWDALSSGRPYRPPWPSEKVTEHLWLERGRHFDPAVVETFLRIPDED